MTDRVVFLFGNGLSIGVDKRFATTSLSKELKKTLDEEGDWETLEALADELLPRPSDGEAVGDFEKIAGPLDRLSDALGAIESLKLSGDAPDDLRSLRDAAEIVRRLHFRLVGSVLHAVDNIVLTVDRTSGPYSELIKMAGDFLNLSQQIDRVWVFTLNYDSLLDAALLRAIEDRQGGETPYPLPFYDGFRFNTLNFPLERWQERLFLYHLHGSCAWVETEAQIAKWRMNALRESRVLEKWAGGDTSIGTPCVVLGDLKARLVQRHPISVFYGEFAARLNQCNLIIVGGYGFGDLPVNVVLASYLRGDSDKRLMVWSHSGDEARVLRALRNAETYLGGDRSFLDRQVNVVTGSLPDAKILELVGA